MYLQDNEELGLNLRPGQGAWGSFAAYAGLAQPKPASCLPGKYIIARFRRGSSRLRDVHKASLKRVAARIVYCIAPTLKGLPSNKGIELDLDLEGHVDAKTDPATHGGLDNDRAIAVSDYLVQQIYRQLDRKGLPPQVSMLSKFKSLGSQQPLGKTPAYADNNRRVEIKVRWKIGSRP
jgi:outer membrane protein OmpA-like peptidoglycan-associated protein